MSIAYFWENQNKTKQRWKRARHWFQLHQQQLEHISFFAGLLNATMYIYGAIPDMLFMNKFKLHTFSKLEHLRCRCRSRHYVFCSLCSGKPSRISSSVCFSGSFALMSWSTFGATNASCNASHKCINFYLNFMIFNSYNNRYYHCIHTQTRLPSGS